MKPDELIAFFGEVRKALPADDKNKIRSDAILEMILSGDIRQSSDFDKQEAANINTIVEAKAMIMELSSSDEIAKLKTHEQFQAAKHKHELQKLVNKLIAEDIEEGIGRFINKLIKAQKKYWLELKQQKKYLKKLLARKELQEFIMQMDRDIIAMSIKAAQVQFLKQLQQAMADYYTFMQSSIASTIEELDSIDDDMDEINDIIDANKALSEEIINIYDDMLKNAPHLSDKQKQHIVNIKTIMSEYSDRLIDMAQNISASITKVNNKQREHLEVLKQRFIELGVQPDSIDMSDINVGAMNKKLSELVEQGLIEREKFSSIVRMINASQKRKSRLKAAAGHIRETLLKLKQDAKLLAQRAESGENIYIEELHATKQAIEQQFKQRIKELKDVLQKTNDEDNKLAIIDCAIDRESELGLRAKKLAQDANEAATSLGDENLDSPLDTGKVMDDNYKRQQRHDLDVEPTTAKPKKGSEPHNKPSGKI